MDLRRLRTGEWVAAVSGVALLVSLFLPWYRPGVCITGYAETLRGEIDCQTLTGWESLAAIDVLLAFVAAAGVLLAIVTVVQGVPAVPIAFSGLLTFVGLFGIGLVLFRVLDLPDGAIGREWGLWLGLAGAAGITAGAAIAMRDERLSPPGRYTDLTGRPVPPPATIDPIAPPRP